MDPGSHHGYTTGSAPSSGFVNQSDIRPTAMCHMYGPQLQGVPMFYSQHHMGSAYYNYSHQQAVPAHSNYLSPLQSRVGQFPGSVVQYTSPPIQPGLHCSHIPPPQSLGIPPPMYKADFAQPRPPSTPVARETHTTSPSFSYDGAASYCAPSCSRTPSPTVQPLRYIPPRLQALVKHYSVQGVLPEKMPYTNTLASTSTTALSVAPSSEPYLITSTSTRSEDSSVTATSTTAQSLDTIGTFLNANNADSSFNRQDLVNFYVQKHAKTNIESSAENISIDGQKHIKTEVTVNSSKDNLSHQNSYVNSNIDKKNIESDIPEVVNLWVETGNSHPEKHLVVEGTSRDFISNSDQGNCRDFTSNLDPGTSGTAGSKVVNLWEEGCEKHTTKHQDSGESTVIKGAGMECYLESLEANSCDVPSNIGDDFNDSDGIIEEHEFMCPSQLSKSREKQVSREYISGDGVDEFSAVDLGKKRDQVRLQSANVEKMKNSAKDKKNSENGNSQSYDNIAQVASIIVKQAIAKGLSKFYESLLVTTDVLGAKERLKRKEEENPISPQAEPSVESLYSWETENSCVGDDKGRDESLPDNVECVRHEPDVESMIITPREEKTDDFEKFFFKQTASKHGITIGSPEKIVSKKDENGSTVYKTVKDPSGTIVQPTKRTGILNASGLNLAKEKIFNQSFSWDSAKSSLEGSISDAVDAFKMKALLRGIHITDSFDSMTDSDLEVDTMLRRNGSRQGSFDGEHQRFVSTPEPGSSCAHLTPPDLTPGVKTRYLSGALRPDAPEFRPDSFSSNREKSVMNQSTMTDDVTADYDIETAKKDDEIKVMKDQVRQLQIALMSYKECEFNDKLNRMKITMATETNNNGSRISSQEFNSRLKLLEDASDKVKLVTNMTISSIQSGATITDLPDLLLLLPDLTIFEEVRLPSNNNDSKESDLNHEEPCEQADYIKNEEVVCATLSERKVKMSKSMLELEDSSDDEAYFECEFVEKDSELKSELSFETEEVEYGKGAVLKSELAIETEEVKYEKGAVLKSELAVETEEVEYRKGAVLKSELAIETEEVEYEKGAELKSELAVETEEVEYGKGAVLKSELAIETEEVEYEKGAVLKSELAIETEEVEYGKGPELKSELAIETEEAKNEKGAVLKSELAIETEEIEYVKGAELKSELAFETEEIEYVKGAELKSELAFETEDIEYVKGAELKSELAFETKEIEYGKGAELKSELAFETEEIEYIKGADLKSELALETQVRDEMNYPSEMLSACSEFDSTESQANIQVRQVFNDEDTEVVETVGAFCVNDELLNTDLDMNTSLFNPNSNDVVESGECTREIDEESKEKSNVLFGAGDGKDTFETKYGYDIHMSGNMVRELMNAEYKQGLNSKDTIGCSDGNSGWHLNDAEVSEKLSVGSQENDDNGNTNNNAGNNDGKKKYGMYIYAEHEESARHRGERIVAPLEEDIDFAGGDHMDIVETLPDNNLDKSPYKPHGYKLVGDKIPKLPTRQVTSDITEHMDTGEVYISPKKKASSEVIDETIDTQCCNETDTASNNGVSMVPFSTASDLNTVGMGPLPVMINNMNPVLYHAVLAQLIQAYPDLACNQEMLTKVAVQQTCLLQMYMANQTGNINAMSGPYSLLGSQNLQGSGVPTIMGGMGEIVDSPQQFPLPSDLQGACPGSSVSTSTVSSSSSIVSKSSENDKRITVEDLGIPASNYVKTSSVSLPAGKPPGFNLENDLGSRDALNISINNKCAVETQVRCKFDDHVNVTMTTKNDENSSDLDLKYNTPSAVEDISGLKQFLEAKSRSASESGLKFGDFSPSNKLDSTLSLSVDKESADLCPMRLPHNARNVGKETRKLNDITPTSRVVDADEDKSSWSDKSAFRPLSSNLSYNACSSDFKSKTLGGCVASTSSVNSLDEFGILDHTNSSICNTDNPPKLSNVSSDPYIKGQRSENITDTRPVHHASDVSDYHNSGKDKSKCPAFGSKAAVSSASRDGNYGPKDSDKGGKSRKTVLSTPSSTFKASATLTQSYLPSNLPPRLRKQRSTEDCTPQFSTKYGHHETQSTRASFGTQSATECWDNEVDDFAETFSLQGDVHQQSLFVNPEIPKKYAAKQTHSVISTKKSSEKGFHSMATLDDISFSKPDTPVASETKSDVSGEWCEVQTRRRRHSSKDQQKEMRKVTTPYTNTAPATGNKNKKSSNFERLVGRLQLVYPHADRQAVIVAIGKIREARGSLSGLSMEVILEKADLYINKKPNTSSMLPPSSKHEKTKNIPGLCYEKSKRQTLNLPKYMPPAITRSNEEEICVICHDPLSSEPVKELDCQHLFHTQCISQWVKQERTCPTCRTHALFPEDFPRLGK